MKIKKVVLAIIIVFLYSSEKVSIAECIVGDTAPPTRIVDLKKVSATDTGAIISLTSPSDASGITTYDIRISNAPISALNFTKATQVVSPTPALAGTLQIFGLSKVLTPETIYYIAIKSQDGCGRWSTMSNLLQFTTPAPPAKKQCTLGWTYNDPTIDGFCIYYGIISRNDSNFEGYSSMTVVDKNSRSLTLIVEPK